MSYQVIQYTIAVLLMKYLLSVFLCCLLVITGCSGRGGEKTETGKSLNSRMQVGLVFSVGGRGDKSFNDSAYNGLELARKKYGISYTYLEPQGEGGDRESALRQMATDPDVALVIGVGLLFSDDITRIAAEFPDKKFICIDYAGQPQGTIPSNLQGIVFEEKNGSYLAGALAGLVTKTKIVGFLGGMESSVIKKFETGFIRGVHAINPDIKVISGYIGMTGSAFPILQKDGSLLLASMEGEQTLSMKQQGQVGLALSKLQGRVKRWLSVLIGIKSLTRLDLCFPV